MRISRIRRRGATITEGFQFLDDNSFDQTTPGETFAMLRDEGQNYKARKKWCKALIHFLHANEHAKTYKNRAPFIPKCEQGMLHFDIAQSLLKLGIETGYFFPRETEDHYHKAMILHIECYGEDHAETVKVQALKDDIETLLGTECRSSDIALLDFLRVGATRFKCCLSCPFMREIIFLCIRKKHFFLC